MKKKKSSDLFFIKTQITWNSPVVSESRKPKPELHFHPSLKHHCTKVKDLRSQRLGCLVPFPWIFIPLHYSFRQQHADTRKLNPFSWPGQHPPCSDRNGQKWWRASHSDVRNPENGHFWIRQHGPEQRESAKTCHHFYPKRMISLAVCPSS